MKKIILISMLMLSCKNSFANKDKNICFAKAAVAIQNSTTNGYDINGIQSYKCEFFNNRHFMQCELRLYKGQGATMDVFRIQMNPSCDQVYRVDFLGAQ